MSERENEKILYNMQISKESHSMSGEQHHKEARKRDHKHMYTTIQSEKVRIENQDKHTS